MRRSHLRSGRTATRCGSAAIPSESDGAEERTDRGRMRRPPHRPRVRLREPAAARARGTRLERGADADRRRGRRARALGRRGPRPPEARRGALAPRGREARGVPRRRAHESPAAGPPARDAGTPRARAALRRAQRGRDGRRHGARLHQLPRGARRRVAARRAVRPRAHASPRAPQPDRPPLRGRHRVDRPAPRARACAGGRGRPAGHRADGARGLFSPRGALETLTLLAQDDTVARGTNPRFESHPFITERIRTVRWAVSGLAPGRREPERYENAIADVLLVAAQGELEAGLLERANAAIDRHLRLRPESGRGYYWRAEHERRVAKTAAAHPRRATRTSAPSSSRPTTRTRCARSASSVARPASRSAHGSCSAAT